MLSLEKWLIYPCVSLLMERMKHMMELGKKILELRKKSNMTQENLAAEMGVSIAAVSKWETGVSMPDVLMLCALADFFEVSTDFLLSRELPVSKYFLVCDDAMFMGSVMTDLITKKGFAAKAVDNSKWLYEEIKRRKPYGIFLDVHFPEENGLDILKYVKEEWPEIHMVMLTADMSEETRKKAEEYGAEYFIYKPFPVEHFHDAMKAIGA